MTEGQGDLLCLSFPLSLLISPNALNSGGLGAEPPCSIGSICDILMLYLRVLQPEAWKVKFQDDAVVHHSTVTYAVMAQGQSYPLPHQFE